MTLDWKSLIAIITLGIIAYNMLDRWIKHKEYLRYKEDEK